MGLFCLKNGKVIRQKAAEIHCRTDASLEGWGSIDLDTNLQANMVDGMLRNCVILSIFLKC